MEGTELKKSQDGRVGRTPSYLRGHGALAIAKAWVPSEVRVLARTSLFPRPRLARLVARADLRTRMNLATPETQIVIDGFQRSANTYAVTSFEKANPAVKLSHHLHSPLSIHEARRFGIPMILLIRTPKDAVSSYLQFERSATPLTALQMYIAYYKAALPYLDDVIVTDFPETVADFGGVVERCNTRFGTDFAPPPASPEFDELVRSTIQEGWNGFHATPLPSAERVPTDEVMSTFDERALSALATAEALYSAVLQRRS